MRLSIRSVLLCARPMVAFLPREFTHASKALDTKTKIQYSTGPHAKGRNSHAVPANTTLHRVITHGHSVEGAFILSTRCEALAWMPVAASLQLTGNVLTIPSFIVMREALTVVSRAVKTPGSSMVLQQQCSSTALRSRPSSSARFSCLLHVACCVESHRKGIADVAPQEVMLLPSNRGHRSGRSKLSPHSTFLSTF